MINITKEQLVDFVSTRDKQAENCSSVSGDEHYVHYFEAYKEKGKIISWNWPAAIFGYIFLWYRGMYLYGLLGMVGLFISTIFAGVLMKVYGAASAWGVYLCTSCIYGLCTDYLYLHHASKKISQGKKTGGVNIWPPIMSILLAVILYKVLLLTVSWYEGKSAKEREQFLLAKQYYLGTGVPQDYQKAFELLAKAAEQEHAGAQYMLGVMYINGQGVSQDYQKAFRWFAKAAEQGHAKAQYNLGMMYARADGITADPKKAVEWITKSAAQGHKNAQDVLKKLSHKAGK